jgi:hypothetical protein
MMFAVGNKDRQYEHKLNIKLQAQTNTRCHHNMEPTQTDRHTRHSPHKTNTGKREDHRNNTVNILQQLQNRQHDIVHVAETRRFLFPGVMQTTRPVDRNLTLIVVDLRRSA